MRISLANATRWLLPAAAVIALAGCQDNAVPDPGDPGLERIGSCSELRDYASDVMLEALVEAKYQTYWLDAMEDGGGPANDASSDGPTDFTTTNVQEEGVDELDIVKTDGNYLYVAQDRALHIVQSWPIEDTTKLATLELDGWVRGLFLKDDKVVVFHNPTPDPDMKWGTRASVIDVSDRAHPVIEREIDVEGWMADARMIDDDVYLIFNHYLELPSALWNLLDGRVELDEIDWDKEGEAFERHIEDLKAKARVKLRPHVDRIANSMDLSDFLPSWRDQEIGEDAADKELMHGCTSLYRPHGIGQHGAMSVVNLDLDNGDLNAEGLLSTGWQLYASKTNLYVAQSSRWWWWGGWDRELETHIHKFELESDGKPQYVASGEVRGWAYDQFAFSEHDGYLRVATTDQDWWWGWWAVEDEDGDEPANNMFVLEDDGLGTLEVVGELGGIAPNERIYATRFFGDHAFMVTFRQVDPLYTIDLKNPKKPAVIGELKLPGYSAYLHPMGDDHLLAVGMDGDDEGRLTGLAFNIFDVSDLKSPTLTHQLTLPGSDWSWSEALWDHHAFTYHRDVLSVPMFEYWNDRSGEGRYFSGAISLSATPDGLSEIGRIDHRPLVRDSECLYKYWWGWDEDVCSGDYWYARVRRTTYIEDNVFSLSDYGLRVTDLNDPTVEHARVLFYPKIR